MTLEEHIDDIRAGLRAGRFVNEAAICQGVVLRLLHALSWPTYDTRIVSPEFSLAGRRVDFALCHPPAKAIAFVEVKKPGQSDGAEKQLFEYAFHEGVPLAILTDGQEWNFFLPAEQGDYGERRVYKLDLVGREIGECAQRLRRYLLHSDIASGAAIAAAREDYRGIAKARQIERALPEAWARLVAEEDELLLELLADKAALICGFKPDPDTVARFLKQQSTLSQATTPSSPRTLPGPKPISPIPAPPVRQRDPTPVTASNLAGTIGFGLSGQFYGARNAIDVLKRVFEEFTKRDPGFPARFAALPQHGRSRRYLAATSGELYPGRADLCTEYSVAVAGPWFMSTNHSKATIARIAQMAVGVAQFDGANTLKVNLGE